MNIPYLRKMIFVTGGTGLLGSQLLYDLASTGAKVKAMYRSEKKKELTFEVFKYASQEAEKVWKNIEWVKGDILDVPFLDEQIRGCTHVYHCAGLVSFSRKDFSTMIKVNRTGTANIVNICLSNNVKSLTHVSSTAAIGKFEKKEVYTEDEKWKPGDQVSGYAISKFSAEKEVWRGMAEGLNISIVNPSIIIGPGDWNSSSLIIFKTVKKGLKFYTTGSNNFVDVRDVSRAMIYLTEHKIYGERFLVAGHHLSYHQIFTRIAQAFNKKPPNIKTSPFIAKIAWRMSSFFSWITGKKPLLTKSSVSASFENVKYSSEKFTHLSGHKFYNTEDTVKYASDFFNKK